MQHGHSQENWGEKKMNENRKAVLGESANCDMPHATICGSDLPQTLTWTRQSPVSLDAQPLALE